MAGWDTASKRFWNKVDASGDCWEWMGAIHKLGYGRFGITQGVQWQAHRFAYTELVGPIPEGLHLDHLCRNRSCVNPDHLEPVTAAENTLRAKPGSRNAAKTHCPRGHAYDDENTIRRNGKRFCRACARPPKTVTTEWLVEPDLEFLASQQSGEASR